MSSGISLALSHQQWPSMLGLTAPVKAVSRRSRARAARALTDVAWSGFGLKAQLRGNAKSALRRYHIALTC